MGLFLKLHIVSYFLIGGLFTFCVVAKLCTVYLTPPPPRGPKRDKKKQRTGRGKWEKIAGTCGGKVKERISKIDK